MIPIAPRLCLIAALGENRVIGADGALPWRLRSDLRRFKALTMGKPVLMGRKTWESLGKTELPGRISWDIKYKPLPGRSNLVVSRTPDHLTPGAWGVSNLPAALAFARAMAASKGAEEFYVIGGESLYRQTLDLADRLYLTEVKASPPGDARFPPFAEEDFEETDRETVFAGPHDAHDSCFRVLDRRR